MSTTQEREFEGGFEGRLLAELTEIDRIRPAARAEAEDAASVGPRRPRLRWRPMALGVAGVLLVAGTVVASGVLGPRNFEPYGDTVIPGEDVGVKGSGCAVATTVTISMDGREIGTTTSNASGAFDFQRALPAGTAMGEHALQASCAGPDGKSVVQNSKFTVVAVRPTTAPAIDVSGEMTPGGEVLVKGGAAKANTQVSILLDGRPLGTTNSDANGSFSAYLTLPDTITVGSHELRAVAIAPDGGEFNQPFQFEVRSH